MLEAPGQMLLHSLDGGRGVRRVRKSDASGLVVAHQLLPLGLAAAALAPGHTNI